MKGEGKSERDGTMDTEVRVMDERIYALRKAGSLRNWQRRGNVFLGLQRECSPL